MSTAEFPLSSRSAAQRSASTAKSGAQTDVLHVALSALASLRLTVVLFALSVFLVFAGTVAQRFYDVWFPVNTMFRSWGAWIELRFFIPTLWAEPSPEIGFPFVGGWTLGALLGANLLAAHAIRFKVTARGSRLVAGLIVLAAGLAATVAVIRSGLDDTLLSQLSPSFANGLWHAYRAALGGGTLALVWLLATTWFHLDQTHQKWLWGLGAVFAAVLTVLSVTLFVNYDWRLDPSGLRILWQLTKGLGATSVLLVGCWLLFAKRAGVVLLHAGVALLMASELHTGLTAVESQMRISEGETVAYAEDMQAAELVLIDKSDPAVDRVVRIPEELLKRAAAAEGDAAIIDDEQLPVLVRVAEFVPNSQARWRLTKDESPATAGWGALRTVDALPSSVGTDTKQTFDIPATYVELLDRQSRDSLGTYLFQPMLPPQVVETPAGKRYEAELRFRRIEKPYTVTLIDFKKEDYVGSMTPKHYESLVQLRDPKHDVDRTVSIWMNNPLRDSGYVAYQTSFDDQSPPGQEKYSVLTVVKNPSDQWPLYSMIAATVTAEAVSQPRSSPRVGERE